MTDCYLEAAESNCPIQRAGLKSKAQSVSCYLKDELFTQDVPVHFHKHSHVTVINIVAHLISKTKSCSYKLSKENESGV